MTPAEEDIGGSDSLKKYWDDRLSARYTLGSTGWVGLGESFNRWMYAVRRRAFRAVVNKVVGGADRSGMRVLDVGSGTGFYIDAWRGLGFVEIAGSDITPTAVDRLRGKYPAIPFHQLDIGDETVPLPPGHFDAVSIMDVLYHIVDDRRYEQAFRNAAGLLKPDGILVLSENFVHRAQAGPAGAHQMTRPREQIEAALADAELEPVLRRPLFFLMNTPVRSTNRFLHAWWRGLQRLAGWQEPLGWIAGATLFPLELLLGRLCSAGPSTEIRVYRRPVTSEKATRSRAE